MEKLWKKLLLSAFAVSLIFSQHSFGEEDKTLDDLLQDAEEDLVELGEAENPTPRKKTTPTSEVSPQVEPSKSADASVEEFMDGASTSDQLTSRKKSVEFLGLEDQVLPDLKGPQRFTPPNMHDHPEMNVADVAVEIDKEPLKGQGYSLIPWSTLEQEQWLSIDRWMGEREWKDKTPDWKQRLRDESNMELAGKVLQCRGTCNVFRGENSASVTHLSRIVEGDEFHTGEDSQAWVYMMDGSLVRIGPKSSLSFVEIDWGKEETLILLRLNKGHAHWSPRNPEGMVVDTAAETDAISLPLLVRNANIEHFERKSFRVQDDRGRLADTHVLDESHIKSQVDELNRLKKENLIVSPDRTRVMMVTPGVTIIARKAALDVVYLFGGDTYFKRGTTGEVSIQKRGYKNLEITPLTETTWHKSTELGRTVEAVTDTGPQLQVLELLTRRVRTLELAREIWFEKFSRPIHATLSDARSLAINHGYVLWGEELQKRAEFLTEYSRRIETTNLRSIENLVTKLEARNEKSARETLSDDYFRRALNHYLMGLKSRSMDKKMQIREMNDLQYYVWILRKGKL